VVVGGWGGGGGGVLGGGGELSVGDRMDPPRSWGLCFVKGRASTPGMKTFLQERLDHRGQGRGENLRQDSCLRKGSALSVRNCPRASVREKRRAEGSHVLRMKR